MHDQSIPTRLFDETVGPKTVAPEVFTPHARTGSAEPVTIAVELSDQRQRITRSRLIRARHCSMRCGNTCILPARRKAAITASAAHARST